MKITQSQENYLKTILILKQKNGYVLSVDVAFQLQVSKPSVCRAVKVLVEKDLLIKNEDGTLCLTDSGKSIAEKIYERHCFFKEGLIKLGIKPSKAEEDACRIEHDISQEAFEIVKEMYRRCRAKNCELLTENH